LTLQVTGTTSTHQVNAQTLLDEITFIKSIAPKDGTYAVLNLSSELLKTYAPDIFALAPQNYFSGQSISYSLINIADNNGAVMTTSVSTNPDKIISLPGTLSTVPINLNALEALVTEINFSDGLVTPPLATSLPLSSKIAMNMPANNLKYPLLTTPKIVSPQGFPLFGQSDQYFNANQAYKTRNKVYAPALNDPNGMTFVTALTQNGFTIQDALTIMMVTNNGGVIGNFGNQFPKTNAADVSVLVNTQVAAAGLDPQSSALVTGLVSGLKKFERMNK